MINKLHGLLPSGRFASLLLDQVRYFASIKLCQALSRQGAIIKIPVVRCHYLLCSSAQYAEKAQCVKSACLLLRVQISVLAKVTSNKTCQLNTLWCRKRVRGVGKNSNTETADTDRSKCHFCCLLMLVLRALLTRPFSCKGSENYRSFKRNLLVYLSKRLRREDGVNFTLFLLHK